MQKCLLGSNKNYCFLQLVLNASDTMPKSNLLFKTSLPGPEACLPRPPAVHPVTPPRGPAGPPFKPDWTTPSCRSPYTPCTEVLPTVGASCSGAGPPHEHPRPHAPCGPCWRVRPRTPTAPWRVVSVGLGRGRVSSPRAYTGRGNTGLRRAADADPGETEPGPAARLLPHHPHSGPGQEASLDVLAASWAAGH